MLRAGKSGVRIPVEGRDFALLQRSRPALGSVPPPTEWDRRSYPGLQRPGREVNHLPPFTAEAKKEWNYTSTPDIRPYGVDKENYYFSSARN
jgi:hypothetical protein